jgi:hypothetical protein
MPRKKPTRPRRTPACETANPPKPFDTKACTRTRVTNGKEFIAGVDQRSLWVRRAKDLLTLHLSDLGGQDNTSEAERSLMRRAAVITVELERMERQFALAGEASAADLDLY